MAPRRPLEPERAWGYLLDLLARRDYTEAELRERLRRRGLSGADADGLMARLEDIGLLDDARFAERWVESRQRTRGRRALRTELQRKGVAAEVVEAELAPLSDEQQLAAATALLERFAWRYRPDAGPRSDPEPAGQPGDDAGAADPEAARRAERRRRLLRARARAFGFLARRGFGPEVAGTAIEALGWWRDDED